jgi:transposase
MLRRWIKEYQADNDGQAFRGNGKLTPEQEEIRRLKLENKQLKLEKQILKEAAVFFAKETK